MRSWIRKKYLFRKILISKRKTTEHATTRNHGLVKLVAAANFGFRGYSPSSNETREAIICRSKIMVEYVKKIRCRRSLK